MGTLTGIGIRAYLMAVAVCLMSSQLKYSSGSRINRALADFGDLSNPVGGVCAILAAAAAEDNQLPRSVTPLVCSGTLIRPTTVLSSGRCLASMLAESRSLVVTCNPRPRSQPKTTRWHAVTDAYSPDIASISGPLYDPAGDIGVLELSSAPAVKPVPLPGEGEVERLAVQGAWPTMSPIVISFLQSLLVS